MQFHVSDNVPHMILEDLLQRTATLVTRAGHLGLQCKMGGSHTLGLLDRNFSPVEVLFSVGLGSSETRGFYIAREADGFQGALKCPGTCRLNLLVTMQLPL